MQFDIGVSWLVMFCVGLVRAGGFLLVAPPFSNPAIPGRVKVAIAVALAAASTTIDGTQETGALAQWVFRLVTEAFVGLALGFGALILFSAVQIAGEFIDLSSGFAAAQSLDPTTGQVSGVIARTYSLFAAALLFSSGGHLLLVRGFVRAGEIVGVLSVENAGRAALAASVTMFVAALEIALPILAALLAAEVGLGILGKASPQLNVFQLGFAVKILFTLFLIASTVMLLPEQVGSLIDQTLDYMAGVSRG